MEQRLAEAQDKHQKVKAGIYVTRWLLDNYPAVTGRMTIDDLMDFLKGEKEKLKDDIEKNGGKV